MSLRVQYNRTGYKFRTFFSPQCHHMSFVDFMVLPPGHGRSVTDFWGWDAHEAQLRCPDGVWVVIEEDVVPGEALILKSTNLPRPWSPRESCPSRKIPTVEPGIEPGTLTTRPRGWSIQNKCGFCKFDPERRVYFRLLSAWLFRPCRFDTSCRANLAPYATSAGFF